MNMKQYHIKEGFAGVQGSYQHGLFELLIHFFKQVSKLTGIIREVWEDIMKSLWKYVGKKADKIIQDKIDKIMERKGYDLAAMQKAKPEEVLFHAHYKSPTNGTEQEKASMR